MLTWGNGLNSSGLGVQYNLMGYPDAKYGITPFVLGRAMFGKERLSEAMRDRL
jgi:hypothetical protein